MEKEKMQQDFKLINQSSITINFSTFIIRLIVSSGILFFGGSLLGLSIMALTVFKMEPLGMVPSSYQTNEITMMYLDYYMVPISLFAVSVIAGIFGYVLVKIAFSSTKKVIPDGDRALLEEIIKADKAEPLKRYISLSSLSGSVGIFTKIGLTGLPLATIALTLIFALLSFFEFGAEHNFIDFTKLTLGAFLGSYVQRNIDPSASSINFENK